MLNHHNHLRLEENKAGFKKAYRLKRLSMRVVDRILDQLASGEITDHENYQLMEYMKKNIAIFFDTICSHKLYEAVLYARLHVCLEQDKKDRDHV